MAVEVTNKTRQRLNMVVIRQAVEATLKFCHQKGDVSVVIIGHSRMKKLNTMYRGKNAVTDVLSFAEAEAETPEKGFLGEIFIDYEVIKQQAKKFSPSLRFELAFIAVHGTLHLLGYDDVTDKGADQMEKMGYSIMKKIV